MLLGLEGFWNIHIVALLVLLSRVSSSSSDGGFHGDYVKPVGYNNNSSSSSRGGRSPADRTYGGSDDEEMMEQVYWIFVVEGCVN